MGSFHHPNHAHGKWVLGEVDCKDEILESCFHGKFDSHNHAHLHVQQRKHLKSSRKIDMLSLLIYDHNTETKPSFENYNQ